MLRLRSSSVRSCCNFKDTCSTVPKCQKNKAQANNIKSTETSTDTPEYTCRLLGLISCFQVEKRHHFGLCNVTIQITSYVCLHEIHSCH
jgi:hypothetical protein